MLLRYFGSGAVLLLIGRANDTLQLREQETSAFNSFNWFCGHGTARPQSVAYNIWGVVQQRVYQLCMHNFDELKRRLLQVCRCMDQSIIDKHVTHFEQYQHPFSDSATWQWVLHFCQICDFGVVYFVICNKFECVTFGMVQQLAERPYILSVSLEI